MLIVGTVASKTNLCTFIAISIMYTYRLFITVVLLLFLGACKKENRGDCFKGVGAQTEELRPLQPFHRILIEKDVDVLLVPDTQEFAIVRCGENLIDLIATDVVNDQLRITNRNTCNWVRNLQTPIKAEIHLKSIDSLYFKGSGQITSADTLRSVNFIIEAYNASGDVDITVRNGWNQVVQHTGNADLTIRGLAPFNTMYSGGNGFLDCRGMVSDETYILHRGTGKFFAAPKNYLGVKIELIGDVYYSGNPTVDKVITGSGRLIKE